MEFDQIYKNGSLALQQFAEYTQNYLGENQYLIYIFIGITSLIVGIKIGKSDISVSKKQIKQLVQFKNQKEQNEKFKEYLLNHSSKLNKFSKIFNCLIFIVNACLIYLDIETVSISMQIAISISLSILTEGYKIYEKYRLSSIKHNLEETEKETNQIIHGIQKNLGDEFLAILKKEALLEQDDKIKKTMVVLQKQCEEKYKGQIEELKKKITTLEDREFQQKQEISNIKRTTQSHKTIPIINQSQNKNEEGSTFLRKEIVHLQKEGQISKDMISKVIQFQWCDDCTALKVHCIESFFQKAKEIGEEYQQKLDQLEKEKLIKN